MFALSSVLALAVLGRPPAGSRPEAVSPTAGPRAPVTSATLLCPDLDPPAGAPVTVDVATAGGTVGGKPGTDGRIWLSAGGAVRDVPTGPARARGVLVQVNGGVPLAVHASGPVAAGLSATVTVPGAPGRAPSRARCNPPRNEFWFVGPGTGTGRDPVIVLTNPETAPARVEITSFGPADRGGPGAAARAAGAVADDGASTAGAAGDDMATTGAVGDGAVSDGVSVPPMARVIRRLTDWVPDAEATAVRIRVRDGRLAAAMLDRAGAPFARDQVVVPAAAGAPAAGAGAAGSGAAGAGGAEPAAGAAGPGVARSGMAGSGQIGSVAAEVGPVGSGAAGSLVLAGTAGIPAGIAGAQVVVAAPEADAVIRLELLTASARFTPPGLAAVRVPGGGVLRLPALTAGAVALPERVGTTAVRVAVLSGGPVVAGLGLPVGPTAATSASSQQAGSQQTGSPPAGGSASDGAAGVSPTVMAAPLAREYRWVGAADVIEPDAAAATLLPAVPDRTLSALVLTAPETTVTVWIDGNPLRVPAGRTVSVGSAGTVRMVTRGGPLVAAQTIGTTDWVATLTLSAAPRTVFVPTLFQDPRAAFRR
ncbi:MULTISPECIES: DUF5719 family protein [Protofrankia]|nr:MULTISPECIES: DUF5719 family protein [Protofrankia]